MSHSKTENCGKHCGCYESGYGTGFKDAWENRPKCWCGGFIGPRTPGDERGLGCLSDITHNWSAGLCIQTEPERTSR